MLSIGPVDLSIGTLFPNYTSTVLTVTDNLYANHAIRNNEIGIYFRPSKSRIETNGELTWGKYSFLHSFIFKFPDLMMIYYKVVLTRRRSSAQ